MGFEALYEKRAEAFAAQIEACIDAREAARVAQRTIDELAAAFTDEEEDARVRARALMLCRCAKAALACVEAAREADVRDVPVKQARARVRLAAVLLYAPCAVACALAAWLYLSGHTNPALLALLGAALSVIGAREHGAVTPVMRRDVTVRANAHELKRRMSFLCCEIDALLPTQDETRVGVDVSTPLLESVQMLMEAKLTGDGAFALKSVPQLVHALEREGVRFSLLGDENRPDFDILPGAVPGQTIRPAVRSGDGLVLRGQATEKRDV